MGTLVIELSLFSFAAIVGYSSFSALFINTPGVHYARVTCEHDWRWHAPRVTFFLDTPTITHLGMLLGGAVCLLATLAALLQRARGKGTWRRLRWAQALGISLVIIMYLTAAAHFMNSAGSFG